MTIPTLAALCDEKGRKTTVASHTPVGVDQMQIAVEDPADDAGLSALRFGRFRVFPKERALFEGDKPVRLGGRALEILIALLERPGQLSLALAAAHGAGCGLNKDVCFLDLTSVESSQVAEAMSLALGVDGSGDGVFASLFAGLRSRQLLLVLDGCESVIASAAYLVRQLLSNLNGLQVLATSREPLRIEGERVLRLRALDFPPPSVRPSHHELLTFPAAQLFVERAKASVQDFRVDETDTKDLAEICSRLDGLPLAIQLAAARVNALGVSGIVRRLGDPLRFFAGGARGAHPRQQSMRANLDWSYDLLTKTEQAVLCLLSTLEGWFSLEQAAETGSTLDAGVNDPFDAVFQLVDNSLALREVRQGVRFFRLSELTRAYAQMKLEDKRAYAIASDL